MRETETCALKLNIFYLGTSSRGLLLTSSGAMIANRCNDAMIAPDEVSNIAQKLVPK